MNRKTIRISILLLIAAAFLTAIAACTNPQTSDDPQVSIAPSPSAVVTPVNSADNRFTVRYEDSYSFNPITGTSPDNMALVPLMYEGLFVLNDNFIAEPVLCESYDTVDGLTYTFIIKSDIAMSDGSIMTATDIRYTLLHAMETGRFSSRLAIISDIEAVDSLTLRITLKSANYKLPELLDVPIIKSNSIDQNYPPGSGPYTYSKTGTPRLTTFEAYRDRDAAPISVIYLKECTNDELSVEFSSQAMDLFQDDPADTADINILSDHEVRYYNTTILQYVGFNTKNHILADPDLRRAFGLTIDRESIVRSVYTSHALPAPLVLSPLYQHYDTKWENNVSDPLTRLSDIFSAIGMDDADSDGFLEIPNSNGGWTPINLTFIVNGDNKYKVQAAQMVAEGLKSVGINVTLSKLSWSKYMTALESGSFDLYFADVCLPANFDLSAMLAPGGALDFGHVANSEYADRIDSFLSSSGEAAEENAAKRLCAYIGEYAPIIPVLYRQFNVHTNKNVVSGMNPAQSTIFYGLADWTITLG